MKGSSGGELTVKGLSRVPKPPTRIRACGAERVSLLERAVGAHLSSLYGRVGQGCEEGRRMEGRKKRLAPNKDQDFEARWIAQGSGQGAAAGRALVG